MPHPLFLLTALRPSQSVPYATPPIPADCPQTLPVSSLCHTPYSCRLPSDPPSQFPMPHPLFLLTALRPSQPVPYATPPIPADCPQTLPQFPMPHPLFLPTALRPSQSVPYATPPILADCPQTLPVSSLCHTPYSCRLPSDPPQFPMPHPLFLPTALLPSDPPSQFPMPHPPCAGACRLCILLAVLLQEQIFQDCSPPESVDPGTHPDDCCSPSL